MDKQEFLEKIRNGLSGLSEEDISKSTDYYSEMIDDRIEEGLSEEEAVKALGSVEDIIEAILVDTSLPKLVKAKAKSNHMLRGWEILLIVLGSPLWVSLLMGVICIIFAIYMVLLSMILVVYTVGISFVVSGIMCVAAAVIVICMGRKLMTALFLTGLGFVCVGIGMLLFPWLNKIIIGIMNIGKGILLGIKHCFIGRRNK